MVYASEKNTNRLKRRIILLTVVAISVFALITTIVIKTYDDLLNAINVLSKPNSEVSLFNKLLTDVSLAENSLRAYTITRYKYDYMLFDSAIQHIEADLDSLMITKSHQGVGMDSIGILLKTQVQILKDFVKSSTYQPHTSADQALVQLNNRPVDSIFSSVYTQIRSTTKSETDSVWLVPSLSDEKKAKGIFKKLKQLLKKEKEASADTLKKFANTSLVINDTTHWIKNDSAAVEMMKTILRDVRNEEKRLFFNQKREELAFLNENSQMIDKIRKVIKRLEKQELKLSSERRAEAKLLVDDSLIVVAGMILFLTIASIIILVLIFADIAKSNFYKTRLERAKNRAENLAKVKQQFLANMSHEIRTPLTAIIGYADILNNNPETDKKKPLKVIQSASKHLLNIVNDILDIAKLESSGLKIKKQPLDINQLIDESCQTFSFSAEQKGLKIIYVSEEEIPAKVEGDTVRLKQIMYNLLDNAIKFTEEGSITVSLKSIEIGQRIENYVTVSDTGIGITEEHLKHIFKNFYQSDESTSKPYSGTGLGLAITKELVKLHGGDIQVRSTVDSGTTFNVFLPLQKSILEEPKEILENPTFNLAGYSILLVDDDSFNLSLLEEILKKYKLCIHQVESPLNALEFLRYEPVDLVITDIHMPKMDGILFLNEIRNIAPSQKVMALTANVTQDFRKYGFSATASKPIDENEFICAIASLLENPPVNQGNNKNTKLYDLSDIYVFGQNDPVAIENLVSTFLANFNDDLKLLTIYHDQDDLNGIAERAHKMIAPCAQLKIHALVEQLRILESKSWFDKKHLTNTIKMICSIGVEVSQSLEIKVNKMHQLA